MTNYRHEEVDSGRRKERYKCPVNLLLWTLGVTRTSPRCGIGLVYIPFATNGSGLVCVLRAEKYRRMSRTRRCTDKRTRTADVLNQKRGTRNRIPGGRVCETGPGNKTARMVALCPAEVQAVAQTSPRRNKNYCERKQELGLSSTLFPV